MRKFNVGATGVVREYVVVPLAVVIVTVEVSDCPLEGLLLLNASLEALSTIS
jgi:hypothetical protein